MTKLLRQQHIHDDNERNNTHDDNEPKTHNSHVMSGESAVNLKVLGSEILRSWFDKIKFLRITVNLDRIQLEQLALDRERLAARQQWSLIKSTLLQLPVQDVQHLVVVQLAPEIQ